MDFFILSYYSSILIQFLSLFIQLYGLHLPITTKMIPLSYALQVEFYVSIVEFLVYLWIGTNLLNFDSIMKKRYLDWFITTNFLLISIALLFIFFKQRQNQKECNAQNNYQELIVQNTNKFIPILIFNNIYI